MNELLADICEQTQASSSMPSVVGKTKSRSSRFSSPLVRNGTPTAKPSSSEWAEPSVKDSKASYEDHGGAPFGVLEDMQPLGQRPSTKVRTRVKAEPLRKSLGKSMGAFHDYNVTPEGTPPVETPRSTSALQEEAALVPLPTMEDEADDDYTPRVAKKSSSRARRTRGSSGVSDMVKTASPSIPPSATIVRASSASTLSRTTKAADISPQELERINFEAVVDSAEKRARALGSDAFGAALRQVYLESQSNDHYAHLLRAILLQTATENDKSDFTTAIKKAKRTLRKVLSAKSGNEVESSVTTTTPKSRSQQESTPHPSIEQEKLKPIKLRLGHRHNDTEREQANGTRPSRSTRARDKSPSPSLSPVPADVDMTDPSEHIELVPSASSSHVEGSYHRRTESSDLIPIGSGLHTLEPTPEARSVSTDLIPVHPGLFSVNGDDAEPPKAATGVKAAAKRSPMEAGFDETAVDMIESTKRRKLNETLYKDPPRKDITESHIRESTDASRSLRTRETVNYRPKLKLTNGTPNTRQKRGREPSDSPLSDMSMSPPPVHNPPTDASTSRAKKKAKTKQS